MSSLDTYEESQVSRRGRSISNLVDQPRDSFKRPQSASGLESTANSITSSRIPAPVFLRLLTVSSSILSSYPSTILFQPEDNTPRPPKSIIESDTSDVSNESPSPELTPSFRSQISAIQTETLPSPILLQPPPPIIAGLRLTARIMSHIHVPKFSRSPTEDVDDFITRCRLAFAPQAVYYEDPQDREAAKLCTLTSNLVGEAADYY